MLPRRQINLADEAILLDTVPAVGLINGAVDVRMSARAVKAKQAGLKVVVRG
jgi:hypothetical protein